MEFLWAFSIKTVNWPIHCWLLFLCSCVFACARSLDAKNDVEALFLCFWWNNVHRMWWHEIGPLSVMSDWCLTINWNVFCWLLWICSPHFQFVLAQWPINCLSFFLSHILSAKYLLRDYRCNLFCCGATCITCKYFNKFHLIMKTSKSAHTQCVTHTHTVSKY